ncbi:MULTISPECIES: hypothetical protein [unclassified Nitratireductor]|uniref:hypothetical protein n=1 Tax=unclassified Nitratireductor TaxID=2641084 RepID=UPI0025DFA9FB|nr:hypothetical protein [Nitratireductor sp.]
MRDLFRLSRYHWLALFLAMSLCAFATAFLSFQLVNIAMANLDFILKHGLMGIADGGLLQFLSILARGLLIVIFYFCFKGMEAELLQRWRSIGRR